MFVRKPVVIGSVVVGVAALALLMAELRPREETAPAHEPETPPVRPIVPTLHYVPTAVGAAASEFGRPWVTHVEIVDLDQDGLQDIIYCEGRRNTVRWIRQSPRGVFTESIIGEDIAGPVHLWAADVNGSGRRDVLVASMGQIMPTNDRIGAVVILENLDNRRFQKRVVIDHIARVTDVRAANLAGHDNRRLDLVVGEFGYNQGETAWLENEGDGQFKRHVVNAQSGAIHTPVADFDGDGRPDFAALIAQEWEEVHLFLNLGQKQVQDAVRWGSTNEDFGSSGMIAGDLDRDGKPDLVFTNGDMFDYMTSGERPWHGIQWLENKGGGQFAYHRIGNLPGAFGPCMADLNGDGFIDVLAVSAFADWSNPAAVSMMAWLNDGHQHFVPVVLAHAPTHLITAAVGDLDGNGIPVIVTGAFHALPPWEPASNITLWRRK